MNGLDREFGGWNRRAVGSPEPGAAGVQHGGVGRDSDLGAKFSRPGQNAGLRGAAGVVNGHGTKQVRPRVIRPAPAVNEMTLREYLRLPSTDLLDHLARLVDRDRSLTVELVTCIAAVEVRRLYRELGFSSTYAYCIATFNMSGDMAFRRIHAARAVVRFPQILSALADGRLHLTAVVLIASHLTPRNVESLINASTRRTKMQILAMLAERFPQPDVPTQLRPIQSAQSSQASGPLAAPSNAHPSPMMHIDVNDRQKSHALERVLVEDVNPFAEPPIETHAVMIPLAATRFELRCTLSQAAHDALRSAQDMLSHAMPNADAAEVIERALVEMVARLQKKQLGAHRDISEDIVRAVRERDGNQCTFVGNKGHRCEERKMLEFDHIRPRSCGGRSTADNLRLRCRVHNQYEAELLFGTDFMERRREGSRSRSG